jgi:hypothetical protein
MHQKVTPADLQEQSMMYQAIQILLRAKRHGHIEPVKTQAEINRLVL